MFVQFLYPEMSRVNWYGPENKRYSLNRNYSQMILMSSFRSALNRQISCYGHWTVDKGKYLRPHQPPSLRKQHYDVTAIKLQRISELYI